MEVSNFTNVVLDLVEESAIDRDGAAYALSWAARIVERSSWFRRQPLPRVPEGPVNGWSEPLQKVDESRFLAKNGLLAGGVHRLKGMWFTWGC